jgi:hypothetical protein
MQTFTVYLKSQDQPVVVSAESYEFNFNSRNADEIDPKLLYLKRGEDTAAVFRLDEIQGFIAPAS